MTEFRWTKERLKAAELVAADDLSDAAIASACGISKPTLYRWRERPEFKAKVQEYLDAYQRAFKARGIAERQNRIDAYNDRWQRMQAVIQARAEAHKNDDDAAPGAETGLLVKQMRSVGFGENNQLVTEWVVDTGLLSELRAHEKQAAQELSQWSERSSVKLDIDSEIEKLAREFDRPVDEVRAELGGILGGGK